MSIEHHPSETMAAAYATGRLDFGQHVAMATHLVSCRQCRDQVRAAEETGGDLLSALPPAPLADDALARMEARLAEPDRLPRSPSKPTAPASEIPGLPAFLRSYPFDAWRSVAPSLEARAIRLPHPTPTRVFLLKARPGSRLLLHTHKGFELTCVLTGGFSHEGGHFGPGDFDIGDGAVSHEPWIDAGQDCISLVAMQGSLKLRGLLGALVQPFVRL